MDHQRLSVSTSVWVLSDGKAGDESQTFAIADALGTEPRRRLVAPRKFFTWLMPYGPIDPREGPKRSGSPLAPPYPDIAIAAGRRTVAYLRHLKRASQQKTFTVFIKDPYLGPSVADLIWVPQHDKLRGDNVIVTPTPAHRITAKLLAEARAEPDPRVGTLPRPRLAMILGGPSQHHRYSQVNETELANCAWQSAIAGWSVMVTPSRRTPAHLLRTVAAALAYTEGPHFIWEGRDANPYVSMLAGADAILVTGDSVNMMAESVATGVPVHIYEPDGGHSKMTAYINHLVALGAARRWSGKFETWTYPPTDATPLIASEIARRYLTWRQGEGKIG